MRSRTFPSSWDGTVWSSSFDHYLAGSVDTVVLASPALDDDAIVRLAR
ncbi:MAG: hypothetical protein U1F77_07945 [Kiritimatiellia bacterium]